MHFVALYIAAITASMLADACRRDLASSAA
jgi:hypothetical protein